jgi:tRNA dimethylallyltransferase
VPTGAVALAIVGPTAAGKSDLAMALARAAGDLELVSVDSMQVYRGMDIGTAKPSAEDRAEVRHHLLDLADPDEEFTVAQFQDACASALADIAARGHRALLVGGTGLYFRAAVGDLEIPGRYPEVLAELSAEPDTLVLHARLARLDPVAAARMEPTNRRRVLRALEVTVGSGRPFSSYGPGLGVHPELPFPVVALAIERDALDRRIECRLHQQLDAGWLDEVAALAARPGGLSRTARQALGYAELLAHLRGELTLDQAAEATLLRTRRFQRRQDRWFRRDPRLTWVEAGHNALAVTRTVLGD